MQNIRAKFDLTIIGAGIIGLATARRVSIRHPKLKICVIDKEQELASHQSKHNSGVVHCGIYYKKGSLKSRFCIKGAQMIKEYCQARSLPYVQCGKLIVATKNSELDGLHDLFANASANKISGIELLNKKQVQKIQPGCTNALEAIWSPNTAIVDWQKVAWSYADDFKNNGGTIINCFTASQLKAIEKSVLIEDAGTSDFIESRSVVNCAGMYADFFARQTGNNEHPKIIPFKGRYYKLSDELSKSIKTNIYPIPDPKMPFLGIHITPRVDGSVLVGPTALLTLGYERYNDEPLRLMHLYHILIRSGLRKLLKDKTFLKASFMEIWRLISKQRFVNEVKELLPTLGADDLINTKFCGIRAQAMGSDGELVNDFLFETGMNSEFSRILHVRNCPSPAATSSLAISERIVDVLEERLI